MAPLIWDMRNTGLPRYSLHQYPCRHSSFSSFKSPTCGSLVGNAKKIEASSPKAGPSTVTVSSLREVTAGQARHCELASQPIISIGEPRTHTIVLSEGARGQADALNVGGQMERGHRDWSPVACDMSTLDLRADGHTKSIFHPWDAQQWAGQLVSSHNGQRAVLLLVSYLIR